MKIVGGGADVGSSPNIVELIFLQPALNFGFKFKIREGRLLSAPFKKIFGAIVKAYIAFGYFISVCSYLGDVRVTAVGIYRGLAV